MSKTILITGGSGFLGSNLCKKLIQDENIKIICVDNNYSGSFENVSDLSNNPRFKFIEHDVIYPLEINEKIDEIYNLACPASPVWYQGDKAIFTTKTCVLGAINMLELAKKNNAKILQASTSEVYGEPLVHPQNENYRGNVNPIGIRACYDEGKRCAESLFFDYNRIFGVKIKVIRIFNTYGPMMDSKDGRVVSNFICQALKNEDLTIYGNGSQTRSFCYVDDLIDAIIKTMATNDDFLGPINLGNPDEFTINELAQLVKEKINNNLNITYNPLPADDPTQRKPDITLAKKILNWEPKVKLSQGLDRTIEYFAKKINPKENK
ncbi:MAG: SDR family oxidoreductase [Candidatus Gastranaerophilales bacterium]|nr:SDR family oxidoreductase [Candidatus Gastranaerophilales bacterium]